MSDGTDETPTDEENLDMSQYPDVERSTYAKIAAEILGMTRRPSTLFGATIPIPASEIIMLADYIANGISASVPPVPDEDVDRTGPAGLWVDVEDLRIGDIYRPDEGYDRTPLEVIQIPHYVEIRDRWDITVRPEGGGRVRTDSFPPQSQAEVLVRKTEDPSTALEFGNVAVSDLWVGDLILDYGDGPIEAEKVIRLAPTSFFHTEVTTIDPRLPEETQGAGTRVLSVDKQVTVRYPRVESVPSEPPPL